MIKKVLLYKDLLAVEEESTAPILVYTSKQKLLEDYNIRAYGGEEAVEQRGVILECELHIPDEVDFSKLHLTNEAIDNLISFYLKRSPCPIRMFTGDQELDERLERETIEEEAVKKKKVVEKLEALKTSL